MKTAIVKLSDGNQITTGINGTEQEILEYYKLGRWLNIGTDEDKMVQAVSVEVIL